MMLYHCVRVMLCICLGVLVLLVIAGERKPQTMAFAFMLIPVCMLMYWLKKRIWLRVNQKKPIVCVEAKLVNHRQQFSGSRGTHYEKSFLTFRLDQSGEEIEFEVPRSEFSRIQLGARGPLEYRGWQFLSFRRHEPELRGESGV